MLSTDRIVLSGKSDEFHGRRENRPVSGAAQHVGESLISDCYYSGIMTKNLGNAVRNAPKEPARSSALSRLAPALFPLAVVALGYLIGWQFFGF